VAAGTIACREALAGDDEGGGIGAEVEEELGEDETGQETGGSDLVVAEAHDTEEDGEDDEAHELNRFPPDGVNS
jgi:hypothetical protein